ncbi:MAG: alpha-mannosidase, partial [Calditrichaeota bacterium]|nr:alpha-mannosidase [Calditrichota bacterium]
LENQFFKIELDENGRIISIYDKQHDREIIEKGQAANVLQIFEDRPLRNNAWDIDIFYQDKCLDLDEAEEIKVVEEGPVRGGLFIKRKFGDSTIHQTISIYNNVPRIDFETKVDWQQHQTLLKVAFPVNIHANHATYEIPYGNIERPTHWNTDWDKGKFEVPAQKWADLSEGDYGVSLLNDCKYGYDIKDNVIRLTLIKSAIDPDPNADIGHHEFCYSLFPHKGNWQEGRVVQAAYELNYPLLRKNIFISENAGLPDKFSFAGINRENIIIETVKKAEDDDRIIIRVYEAYNQRGEAEMEFAWPIKSAAECNLLEKDEQPLDFSGNKIHFNFKPYEIKTFSVIFLF